MALLRCLEFQWHAQNETLEPHSSRPVLILVRARCRRHPGDTPEAVPERLDPQGPCPFRIGGRPDVVWVRLGLLNIPCHLMTLARRTCKAAGAGGRGGSK